MIARLMNDLSPVHNDFQRLLEELENIDTGLRLAPIRSVPRGTYPAVNISQDGNSFYVKVFAPGIDISKAELVYQDNAITIKGTRQSVETNAKQSYHRRERFAGSFSRVISLPDGLDPENINAKYTDGVLFITIAKKPETKPRQIEVKVS